VTGAGKAKRSGQRQNIYCLGRLFFEKKLESVLTFHLTQVSLFIVETFKYQPSSVTIYDGRF
jgi:hypothetical protein